MATLKSRPTSIEVTKPADGSSALGVSSASLGVSQSLLFHSKESNGFDAALLEVEGDNILNYGGLAHYDPVAKEVHAIGQGHIRKWRHVKYSEATNKWSMVSENPSFQPLGSYGHGYYLSTIDQNGNLYWRSSQDNNLYKWTRTTQTWAPLGPMPPPTVANALIYHQALNRILYVALDIIWACNNSTGLWEALAVVGRQDQDGMGGLHNMGVWCPAHNCVVAGGGNKTVHLWKISASGEVTKIADSPVGLDIPKPKMVYDPASTKVLVFPDGATGYEYNISSNSWATFTRPIPTWSGDVNHTMYVSLHGHRRIMLLKAQMEREVWLYRHA